MKKKELKNFVLFSFFVAIELLLLLTPLGFVPLGAIRITTLHIPVIICSIVLGYKYGALLGFVFGLTSLFINTFNPVLTSFIFSPFIKVGNTSGNFFSLIIVFVPRILLGLISGLIYKKLNEMTNKNISIVSATIISTFTHTFLVLSFIFIFFSNEYASARNIVVSNLFNVLMGIVFTNGILEIILAIMIVLPVVKAIEKIRRD